MQDRLLTLDVYCASDVVTSDGVMKGEFISFADELVLDDSFQIIQGARQRPLTLISERGALRRDDASGNLVHLDSCLTLMDTDGTTHEVLILVEVEDDMAAEVFVLSLGEMVPLVDYRLVGIARHLATKRFAEAASGSFAKGTRITLRDGRMCPVEALSPGDEVLTRDAGPQPIKSIGHATLRATGSFAPVVIPSGALNNEGDLLLRPDHRLFIYQRDDRLGSGRAEVLVKARHLVDGQSITRRKGGFVDYYQLIFDAHHIIFAEGIAAESHLVDPRTHTDQTDQNTPHSLHGYHDYEVKDNLIPLKQAAALLRKASGG
ncbi:Hint domain-containing protein [Yoonia litorea]|uniref:Hint domain-containing protein n=1 Tax=Yoonia litorea TaxID=1123755 RepID=A0A1I6LUG3_9RHOB|nr:Hint domain-containing protein [Yoonia litorea]SFS07054.1 Hint domain-containing protein [Yoonia litorea]